MKPLTLKLIFTVLFALLSTALASVLMYTLPVLDYIGSGTQVIPLLMGFMLGTVVFSIIGAILALYTQKPVILGLVFSLISLISLGLFFRLSGPETDLDILIGSFSTQSFAILFSSMIQGIPGVNHRKRGVVFSLILFDFSSLLIFMGTAVIYLIYGQAFLPNIVVYIELIAALASTLVILVSLGPKLSKGR